MNRCRFLLLAVLGLALGPGADGPVRARLEPRSNAVRVKALLVLDTSDPGLADGVRINGKWMEDLLKSQLGDRVDIARLEGDRLTKEDVLAHYKDLKVEPTDGLLFYYAGHGSFDREKGDQVFEINQQKGPPYLYRDAVLRALRDRKPRLLVVLSDSCANEKNFIHTPRPVMLQPKAGKPLARLLLETEGEYIQNAAARGEPAFYQDRAGGFFTFALYKELTEGPAAEGDNQVTWKDLAPRLQERVNVIFRDAKKAAGDSAPPEVKERDGQKLETPVENVRAFVLRPLMAPPPGRNGYRLGVVLDPGDRGVKIREVRPGSPAARVGLEVKDVILAINDQPVNSLPEFIRLVDASGGSVRLLILDIRTGKEMTLDKVILEPMDGIKGYKLGAHVVLRAASAVGPDQPRGVLIDLMPAPGSPAARSGLKPNDVILEINGQPVNSLEDYARLLDGSGGSVRLLILDGRTGKPMTVDNVVLEPIPDK
jgi:S1-C subfamily serine protease